MLETEALLEKCTELILAVNEIEEELPELKAYFEECKNLHKNLCEQIEKDDNILNDKYTKCQQAVDKQLEKINVSVKKCEQVQQIFNDSNAIMKRIAQQEMVLQSLMKSRQEDNIAFNRTLTELKEQIGRLENRVGSSSGSNIVSGSVSTSNINGSLQSVLSENGFKLPMAIQRNNWSKDYYFVVEYIDAKGAHGHRYSGDNILQEDVFDLKTTSFIKYEQSKVVPFVLDDLEEELPFN